MRKLIVFSILLIVFISCKKDNDSSEPENTPPTVQASYFPMTFGNYWVYENYKIDSLGNEELLTEIDSLVITKDSIINGKKYFVIEGISYPFNTWKIQGIYRDSAGYLINHLGKKLFCNNQSNDTLYTYANYNNQNDTVYSFYLRMTDSEYTLEVPAGSFSKIMKSEGSYYLYNPNNENIHSDILDYYYAPSIGKIQYNWKYASAPWRGEKRLLRYSVDVPIMLQ